MFLVQHVDSVIQILVGLLLTWWAFRGSSRLGARARKVLKLCGPALIVIGGLLLLRPSGDPKWERQFTADKVASAEFPGVATSERTTDTLGDVAVERASLTYKVPGKDISLFLSSSALPENARALTGAQRIEGTVAYFVSQGAKVVQNDVDSTGSVYRVTLRQEHEKVTTRMAIAYDGASVYRAVASSADDQADDALTERFVASFRLSSARSGSDP